MSLLSKLFGKKEGKFTEIHNFLLADMHSHLIPGIDDGVQTDEDCIQSIKELVSVGYKKLITTPHIMSDSFKNTPEIILNGLAHVKELAKQNNIDVELEAAAEYYVDEKFLEMIPEKKLLTFGKNYVLIETNYISRTPLLNKAIFDLKMNGYKPILAHPERYVYLYDNFDLYKEIYDREIPFQVNLFSLVGYYSPKSREISEKLIANNMVDFIGTDLHGLKHFKPLNEALLTGLYRKLEGTKIRNAQLM